MEYSDYQYILFQRRDPHILWMTLNRPEVLNATNARMHTELVEVWQTVEQDPSVRVAVVTGAGRAFSAGGDYQLVEEAYQNYAEIARILEEARDLVYNILNCRKPIVSAINGAAVGAGLVAIYVGVGQGVNAPNLLPSVRNCGILNKDNTSPIG